MTVPYPVEAVLMILQDNCCTFRWNGYQKEIVSHFTAAVTKRIKCTLILKAVRAGNSTVLYTGIRNKKKKNPKKNL